ncbi:MAG: glycosyltransferase family 4 protein [Ignavibacteriae bacterium]|nr:glycosyltransferase WbuB [Ignavibacteriota bacterium]NOH00035.1 glycosyltransferase family 4 protein [Ignavibacteriota bacterium]
MKKRLHILFLTHYFTPEVNAPANRTFEHARRWVNDADVTVLTNFPNHPDGQIFEDYKNKLVQKENINGINVVRIWTFITPNEGFVLRTLNFLIYMFGAILYTLFSRIKFDVVIATTPQFFCGLAGKYISKIKRKPFILELRDLWPESIIAVGAIKNKTIIKILENIELNLYKSAKKIISVTRSFKENLVSRGIEKSKIEVMFNGVSFDVFTNGAAIKDTELNNYLNSGFSIGYIGTIGLAHSIFTLVKAAEKLKDSNVNFIIVGSGAQRANIEREIKAKNLTNIKVFPIQSKDQIPSIINKLDIFCVHLKKDPLFKTVIPSKLFEGMAMKKPILIGVDGESRTIVEDAECGLFFEPENEIDLIDKIARIRDDKKLEETFGNNGYTYVKNNFDREKIANQYLSSIKQTVL